MKAKDSGHVRASSLIRLQPNAFMNMVFQMQQRLSSSAKPTDTQTKSFFKMEKKREAKSEQKYEIFKRKPKGKMIEKRDFAKRPTRMKRQRAPAKSKSKGNKIITRC